MQAIFNIAQNTPSTESDQIDMSFNNHGLPSWGNLLTQHISVNFNALHMPQFFLIFIVSWPFYYLPCLFIFALFLKQEQKQRLSIM